MAASVTDATRTRVTQPDDGLPADVVILLFGVAKFFAVTGLALLGVAVALGWL